MSGTDLCENQVNTILVFLRHSAGRPLIMPLSSQSQKKRLPLKLQRVVSSQLQSVRERRIKEAGSGNHQRLAAWNRWSGGEERCGHARKECNPEQISDQAADETTAVQYNQQWSNPPSAHTQRQYTLKVSRMAFTAKDILFGKCLVCQRTCRSTPMLLPVTDLYRWSWGCWRVSESALHCYSKC